MSLITTYSFSDIVFVMTHPVAGDQRLNGEGLGDVTVTFAQDNTSQDLSADGSVMVNKIKASNGSIAINIQQTAPLNHWLVNYFNLVKNDSTSLLWAQAQITISSIVGGDNIVATGVSPHKRPDLGYQQQGQQRTWNFMAADIQMLY